MNESRAERAERTSSSWRHCTTWRITWTISSFQGLLSSLLSSAILNLRPSNTTAHRRAAATTDSWSVLSIVHQMVKDLSLLVEGHSALSPVRCVVCTLPSTLNIHTDPLDGNKGHRCLFSPPQIQDQLLSVYHTDLPVVLFTPCHKGTNHSSVLNLLTFTSLHFDARF